MLASLAPGVDSGPLRNAPGGRRPSNHTIAANAQFRAVGVLDIPAVGGGDALLKADLRRPAQPEELAPAYVFLASPCTASYITGIVLPVTGEVGAI